MAEERYRPFDPSTAETANLEPAAESVAEASIVTEETLLGRVHEAVSAALAERVRAEGEGVVALGVEAFGGAGNVVGVGIGRALPVTGVAGPAAPPGAQTLNVYVVEPVPESRVREALAADLGVEAAADREVPVQVVVTGEITAQPHTFRVRPAPGGVSVGHFAITAGTLGCLARGRSEDRAARLLILSNNHVLADVNAGSFGDAILQPGPADGGVAPADRIAVLERFVTIDFGGAPNLVDCATAWADPEQVRREIVYLDGDAQPAFFRLGSRIRPCRVGLPVAKSGRTTQLTSGQVIDCAATVRVRFGARTALFQDQIAIRGIGGDFSKPGDSGSIVFTRDEERHPVGLLFAGGLGTTFANKLDHVLSALDVELVV